MLLNLFPSLVVFVFLLLGVTNKGKGNLYIVSIFLILILFFTRIFFTDIGGDIQKYYIYFNQIEFEDLILNGWLNGALMIFIRTLFGDFIYYQFFVVTALIASIFFFTHTFLESRSMVGSMLIITMPIIQAATIVNIVFGLAFAVALFAFTFLERSKKKFIFVALLSASIHWSLILIIPLAFYDNRSFWRVLIIFCLALIIFPKHLLYDIDMFSFLERKFNPKIERDILPHHIFMYCFFVMIGFWHSFALRRKSIEIPFIGGLSLLIMLFVLLLCFIFINSLINVVRLGFFINFFFLVYILSVLRFFNLRQKYFILLFIAAIFALMSFDLPTDRLYNFL